MAAYAIVQENDSFMVYIKLGGNLRHEGIWVPLHKKVECFMEAEKLVNAFRAELHNKPVQNWHFTNTCWIPTGSKPDKFFGEGQC